MLVDASLVKSINKYMQLLNYGLLYVGIFVF